MEASVISNYLRISLWSFAFAFWLYWLWTRRNLYKFSLKFPSYWGLPFLGLVGCYLKTKYDILSKFGKILEKSRNTVSIWIGVNSVLLTSEPALIEKVLTSSKLINKSQIFYKFIGKMLGDGLITESANKWYRHRKLINPAFQHKALLSLFPFFEEAKRNLIKQFDSMDDNQEHSIFYLITSAVFNITFTTTLGTKLEYKEKMFEFCKDFKYLLNLTAYYMLANFLCIGWLYWFNKKYFRVHRRFTQFIKQVLDSKLNQANVENTIGNVVEDKLHESNCDSIKKMPNIFIDQVIQIYRNQEISYEQIVFETNNIFGASFETTSNTIFSTIVMLAMHPHVQERLFEEIYSEFPDKDFQMDYDQIRQLPYFDMVLNEVLRLAPALPLIGRQVVEDTKIDKDLTLPKDSEVLISVFHLHRRKDIWGPNADQFDPDHFLPQNMIGRHSYSFIPFSKGARNCIGWRYALFSMKIILIGLLRNFKFSTDFKYEDLEFIQNITIAYKKYPHIKIQRR